jgi:hypothetical protein
MPQPTDGVPNWAETAATIDVVAPSPQKRSQGWVEEQPPHTFFNWWQRTVGRWIGYLANLTAENLQWTGQHTFGNNVSFDGAAELRFEDTSTLVMQPGTTATVAQANITTANTTNLTASSAVTLTQNESTYFDVGGSGGTEKPYNLFVPGGEARLHLINAALSGAADSDPGYAVTFDNINTLDNAMSRMPFGVLNPIGGTPANAAYKGVITHRFERKTILYNDVTFRGRYGGGTAATDSLTFSVDFSKLRYVASGAGYFKTPMLSAPATFTGAGTSAAIMTLSPSLSATLLSRTFEPGDILQIVFNCKQNSASAATFDFYTARFGCGRVSPF